MQQAKRACSISPEAAASFSVPGSPRPLSSTSSSSSAAAAGLPSRAPLVQGAPPTAPLTPLRERRAVAFGPEGDLFSAQVSTGEGDNHRVKYPRAGAIMSADVLNILPTEGEVAPWVSGLFDPGVGCGLALVLSSRRAVALSLEYAAISDRLRQRVSERLHEFEEHTGAPADRTVIGIGEGAKFENDMKDHWDEAADSHPDLLDLVRAHPDRSELASARIWLEQHARRELAGLELSFMSLPSGAVYIGRDGKIDTFAEGPVRSMEIPDQQAPDESPSALDAGPTEAAATASPSRKRPREPEVASPPGEGPRESASDKAHRAE